MGVLSSWRTDKMIETNTNSWQRLSGKYWTEKLATTGASIETLLRLTNWFSAALSITMKCHFLQTVRYIFGDKWSQTIVSYMSAGSTRCTFTIGKTMLTTTLWTSWANLWWTRWTNFSAVGTCAGYHPIWLASNVYGTLKNAKLQWPSCVQSCTSQLA